MPINPIPEKLIAFRAYLDGVDLLGVADVDLPDIEFMTETVSGAGIAGELDSPVLAHTQSMTLSLNWRVITANATALAAPKGHHLDLRGSVQYHDAAEGELTPRPVKLVVKGLPKKTGLGKLETGKQMETATELEVYYLKLLVDGRERMEIDKLNYKFVVDGVDYLRAVNDHLGR